MKQLLFFLLLFHNIILAQTDNAKVYLDKDFKETTITESPYYRIIENTSSEKEAYKFTVFYKSGKVYKEGFTNSKSGVIENGLITCYYENGNKMMEYNVDKGLVIGNKIGWHENGVKKYIKQYEKIDKEFEPLIKIIQYWNDANEQKVIDGNGYFEDEDEENCFEKGMVQNSLKTGKWEGFNRKMKLNFIEDYNSGVLIQGVSTDSLSNQYKYNKVKEVAKPRKGIEHFYEYIGKKFKIPKGIESGRMLLTFIIEKDGSISNLTVLRSAGETLDKEAKRLISNYPDWQPGKYRGMIARLLYSIPITIQAPTD
ncbi:energy transducer TonB [Flavobacterium sp. 25HG05S-40]|uniref:energy transducer TonB n=1 Tax=Flavobacterium sp. 25HG05S-40 TaxID=3458682 RepID=UPI0040443798